MFDFNTLSEFSRTNCIGICAFLVPAILLLTLQTIIFTSLRQPQSYALVTAGIATLCGLVMVLHVLTWFMVGVVMAPTFILLYMAATCFIVNTWAIAAPQTMTKIVTAGNGTQG